MYAPLIITQPMHVSAAKAIESPQTGAYFHSKLILWELKHSNYSLIGRHREVVPECLATLWYPIFLWCKL